MTALAIEPTTDPESGPGPARGPAPDSGHDPENGQDPDPEPGAAPDREPGRAPERERSSEYERASESGPAPEYRNPPESGHTPEYRNPPENRHTPEYKNPPENRHTPEFGQAQNADPRQDGTPGPEYGRAPDPGPGSATAQPAPPHPEPANAQAQDSSPRPASAPDPAPPTPRPACVITADGAYAARLACDGASWFPERWTLDGPEPYAVPLPGNQPEEPGTEVAPMGDGRVLIRRVVDGRHSFSLLYPTGPRTGEVPLGAVSGGELTLLPPAPGGRCAYAIAVGERSTGVWMVAGGAFGPEFVAEVPGHCSGGVWLDRSGRMLALDRSLDGGPVKTVAVDLGRGGEVTPLLQIAESSADRLVLADPDSGLLLIRSDAPSPGQERLGWGVLGSTLPVRFPECLRLTDCMVTPFAIQPGQTLMPESCAVALRIDGAAGTWLGLWRPAERQMHQLGAPQGWLAGSGSWTRDGELQLPYATESVPCGIARTSVPEPVEDVEDVGEQVPQTVPEPPAAARPVPLQQAPLAGLMRRAPAAGTRAAPAG
ncbi:hypothetical protein [Streptomyces sp. NBC_01361]|uniref:hypothetical protein n=1 Tax=Streptomyces sp. NBC_01361 TaxID=2903838 RepID=UPI002E31AE4E|nr:hypothetical protein [Streptomyces sp. NBC_01361]